MVALPLRSAELRVWRSVSAAKSPTRHVLGDPPGRTLHPAVVFPCRPCRACHSGFFAGLSAHLEHLARNVEKQSEQVEEIDARGRVNLLHMWRGGARLERCFASILLLLAAIPPVQVLSSRDCASQSRPVSAMRASAASKVQPRTSCGSLALPGLGFSRLRGGSGGGGGMAGAHQPSPEELDMLGEREGVREAEEQHKRLQYEVELENSELPAGFDEEVDETESKLASIITHSAQPESNDDSDAARFARALHSPAPLPKAAKTAQAPERRRRDDAAAAPLPPAFDIRPWSPAELERRGIPLPGSEDFPSEPHLVEVGTRERARARPPFSR